MPIDAEFQARITAKNQTGAAFAEVSSTAAKTSRALHDMGEGANKAFEHFGDASLDKGKDALKDLGRYALTSIAPILGVDAAIEGVKGALEDFGKIAHQSKAAGIDAEFFQELAFQAGKSDVPVDDLAASLDTFNKNSGQAANGIGRMLSQLKTLDPELLKQIQNATSQEERIKLVADAIEHQTSAAKASAIATAAFGEAGSRLVEVFKGGRSEMEATAEEARKLGLVVSDELVERADELGTEFSTASKILDLDFKKALVELAPFLTGTAEGIGGIVKAVGDLGNAIRNSPGMKDLAAQTAPLSERESAVILQQIADKQAFLDKTIAAHNDAVKNGGDLGGWFGSSIGYDDGVKALQDELNSLRGRMASRSASFDTDRAERADHTDSLRSAGRALLTSSAGGSGGDAGAQAAAAKKIADVNKQLDLQIKNLGLTNEQQQINNELTKAGVTADSDAGKAITAKVEKLYSEQKAISELNAETQFFATTTESALQNVVDGSESAVDALGDVAEALEAAVLQAALLGTGPLGNIFGGAPTTAGATGGLLAGVSGWLANALPGHAAGTANTGGAPGQVMGLVHGQEAVIPLPAGGHIPVMVSGANSNVPAPVIIFEDHVGVKTTTKQETGPRGQPITRVIISEVARSTTTPGSPMARALGVGYGAKPQLTRRGGN